MANRSKLIGALLVGGYILLRMVADPFFWRNFSEYYSYAFEVGFVALACFLFRGRFKFLSRPSKDDAIAIIAAAVGGLLVYRAASWVGVPIPFDLNATETIFLLLVLGPILEEAVFRLAIWEGFQALTGNSCATLVATTLLFAAGHFAAYWFVPAEFHGFVIYQTSYVILLGLAAGWRRRQTNAISSAVVVHFGFNAGFFLASRLFAGG